MIYPTFPNFPAAAVPLQLADWGRVLIVSIPLLAALCVGMAVLHQAHRQAREGPMAKPDPLAAFRAAHQAGEIDDAEFRRLTELILKPAQPGRPDPVRKPSAAGAGGAGRPDQAGSTRPDEEPTAETS